MSSSAASAAAATFPRTVALSASRSGAANFTFPSAPSLPRRASVPSAAPFPSTHRAEPVSGSSWGSDGPFDPPGAPEIPGPGDEPGIAGGGGGPAPFKSSVIVSRSPSTFLNAST